jgi:hypothetical protein
MSRNIISNQATRLSFSLPSSLLFTNHPIIWHYLIFVIESAIKQMKTKVQAWRSSVLRTGNRYILLDYTKFVSNNGQYSA